MRRNHRAGLARHLVPAVLLLAIVGLGVLGCEDDGPSDPAEVDLRDPPPGDDPEDPGTRPRRVVLFLGEGGKIIGHEVDRWDPTEGYWYKIDEKWRPGTTDGTKAHAQYMTQVFPVDPSGTSAAAVPLLESSAALFAGGYGPDGAGAGDQAYHMDLGNDVGTELTMTVPRSSHTLTALLDGPFLVAGGFGASFVPETWASAEIFDPGTKRFTATGAMGTPRAEHTAALLDDGRVLVAGGTPGTIPGQGAGVLASTEIYDPAAGTFSPGPDMTLPRRLHTAVSLVDGRVLVVAGNREQGRSAELYDPAGGAFTALPELTVQHGKWHQSTLLMDGRVLITGGDGDPDGFGVPTAAAEIFDPGTGTFTAVGDMVTPRMKHFAVLQPDSTVLIGGGIGTSGFPIADAEVYDPRTRTFTRVDDVPRVGAGQAAVLLVEPPSS